MVHLFGGEIGWIENFREKIGRKFFLQCVWLGGEKKKKMVGSKCFLPGPTKKLSLQN